MRPYIICHMLSSIDGRILPRRWRPEGLDTHGAYEQLHDELGGSAWLVGRVTGAEMAKGAFYPERTDQRFPRENWRAHDDASTWAVVLDAQGKIRWGRSDVGGDPLLVILTEVVSDAHLAGLRADGVSYLFAGESELDLAHAMRVLREECGIERLLLEGGGGVNAAFLMAGLIDEISLIVAPVVDGASGAPSVFQADASVGPAPIGIIEMVETKQLDGGLVWLRYRITNA